MGLQIGLRELAWLAYLYACVAPALSIGAPYLRILTFIVPNSSQKSHTEDAIVLTSSNILNLKFCAVLISELFQVKAFSSQSDLNW